MVLGDEKFSVEKRRTGRISHYLSAIGPDLSTFAKGKFYAGDQTFLLQTILNERNRLIKNTGLIYVCRMTDISGSEKNSRNLGK